VRAGPKERPGLKWLNLITDTGDEQNNAFFSMNSSASRASSLRMNRLDADTGNAVSRPEQTIVVEQPEYGTALPVQCEITNP
jgi:hypothetical protein